MHPPCENLQRSGLLRFEACGAERPERQWRSRRNGPAASLPAGCGCAQRLHCAVSHVVRCHILWCAMRVACTAAAQRLRSVNRRVGVGVGNSVGIFGRVRAVAKSDATDTLIGGRPLLQAELQCQKASLRIAAVAYQTAQHIQHSVTRSDRLQALCIMGMQIDAALGVRYAEDHDLQGRGPLFHREVSTHKGSCGLVAR